MRRIASGLFFRAPEKQLCAPKIENKMKGGTIIARHYVQGAAGHARNDGAILIHGLSGSAGCFMREVPVFQGWDLQNQDPVAVIGTKAYRMPGRYQAGGNIAVLGLLFHNAPVFRFFKTEKSIAIVQEPSEAASSQASENMRNLFLNHSGWIGLLIGYFTSGSLKQKSVQTVVSDITARGVMFCEG